MSRDHDIVDYLLDELGPDDTERVERRMRDEPAFRGEVERMRPLVADLEALPGEAWDAGAAVPPLPPLPPLSELEDRRARRRLSIRPAYAVAASVAVLLIGVAVGAVVTHRGADEGPAIALGRIDQGGPAAAGTARFVNSGGGQLRVQVDGLAPSSPHDFYEVWLMDGPGGRHVGRHLPGPRVGARLHDDAPAGASDRLPLHRRLEGARGRQCRPLGALGAAGADHRVAAVHGALLGAFAR